MVDFPGLSGAALERAREKVREAHELADRVVESGPDEDRDSRGRSGAGTRVTIALRI